VLSISRVGREVCGRRAALPPRLWELLDAIVLNFFRHYCVYLILLCWGFEFLIKAWPIFRFHAATLQQIRRESESIWLLHLRSCTTWN
jgi:hypothetical protein